jgi:hypothetical protein
MVELVDHEPARRIASTVSRLQLQPCVTTRLILSVVLEVRPGAGTDLENAAV